MAKSEFSAYTSGTFVADLTGKRHGKIAAVIRKGEFIVRWDDNTSTSETNSSVLLRWTTQSRGF